MIGPPAVSVFSSGPSTLLPNATKAPYPRGRSNGSDSWIWPTGCRLPIPDVDSCITIVMLQPQEVKLSAVRKDYQRENEFLPGEGK